MADGLFTRLIGWLAWSIIVPMMIRAVGILGRRVWATRQWLAARGIGVESSGAATTAAPSPDLPSPRGSTTLVVGGGQVSIWRGTIPW